MRSSLGAVVLAVAGLALLSAGAVTYAGCPDSQPLRNCVPPFQYGMETGTRCDAACGPNQTCPNENVTVHIKWADAACSGSNPTDCVMNANPDDLPIFLGYCTKSSDCPNPEVNDKCIWTVIIEQGESHPCTCYQE
jgi:hypothetical protein